jgi:predicted RNA methylase
MVAHAVIDAPAGENHLGMMAERLGAMREIVGIDADAMTADEADPAVFQGSGKVNRAANRRPGP